MKVIFVGTGYVGLVSGTCFAQTGVQVCCIDIDKQKIDRLRRGEIPIYEPGLEQMVLQNSALGRLRFSSSLVDELPDVDVVFCAPGTPSMEDGSADLSAIRSIALEVGQNMTSYKLVIIKSTVPVGTVLQVKKIIDGELQKRKVEIAFDVASNPEFLREGNAVHDFMHPDRIVIGVESDRARQIIESLYKPFTIKGHPIMFMDIASAEMTKYASNAMLATRISFINEIARLCEEVGADVHRVREGMGSDPRIGPSFLNAGTGYGGFCFPKDVKALIYSGKERRVSMRILEATEEVNNRQKLILVEKLIKYFEGQLSDKTVALWGLSFKPQTDDLREAPSLVIIRALLDVGVKLRVFDPVAMPEVQVLYGDTLTYGTDIYDTVNGADALLLVTEWEVFASPCWEEVKRLMKGRLVLDGRNIYDGDRLRGLGMEYFGIGRR
ncbi:MAG: UDP-glucose/GDP-mannose dehydrogenase family protein [Prevotellaceae bacterium]|jgi:UDPglucose 6-dehydrogenase|nr:UDP-glucose/GDP-mannose dehydrogenase family protein [Prevotellaceae bacterium]